MEWFFYMIVIFCLLDIETKLGKMMNNHDVKKNTFVLENYIGKKVSLNIDNDDITDSYLFSSISNTIGEIVEYDDEWFLFRYYNKSKKQTVNQYIRIHDIISINEIK